MIRIVLVARVVAFLALVPCFGQRLSVYSPLTRIDPTGAVVKADRGKTEPRTILSPGVPRNGFTPIRIVVTLDKPDHYWLEIGQNPENAVKATLYKENFVETAGGWVPDTLQEVSNPYRGFPTDFRLPGQKVVTFWLDMQVAKDAPVDRIKVEPQAYVESIKDWVVYPMEVRVQDPVLPSRKPATGPVRLPPVTASADSAIFGPLYAAMCGNAKLPGATEPEPKGQLTGRELLQRYAQQDLALASDSVMLQTTFINATGLTNVKAWCDVPATLPAGPEWYLRLRDALYRKAGAKN